MTSTLPGSLLGRPSILKEMEEGSIIIYPFNIQHLSSASYDVTLGDCYYLEQATQAQFFNPYSEESVKSVWGSLQQAKPVSDFPELLKSPKIKKTDKVIWIDPGSTILAHTNEFVGGRKNVLGMMKTRSSLGRSFISVCKCAGWGDIGFYNRWTMEITNNSKHYRIPLIVGRRIAQIVFFRAEGYGTEDELRENKTKYTSESHGSKYQSRDVLPPGPVIYDEETQRKLKSLWGSELMLPRLYMEEQY